MVSAATAPETANPNGVMGIHPLLFCFLLFVGCIFIGVFAVLGGVGGGVIFTPLFMGFTPIDSYIVRSTGLFVAMAGTLVAARPFLRNGIANIKLLLVGAVPYTVFAVVGALLAGYIEQTMGASGEAFIRGALGIVIIGIGALFIFFGGRTEYPTVDEVDGPTQKLGLPVPYWEDSLEKVVRYKLTRVVPALLLFCGVGLISGLFGIGAGGAMVPVFNLVMLAPLKVAATCSTVMISLGSTAAVWPYILSGGMFPLVAVPCMIGMIVGAHIGARIMLRVKAGFVRWVIIALMIGAGVRLITKAIHML
ncbi:MAG: sulfite exporter TauE/SafE family protein [Planctomycetota bacterium]